MFPWGKPSSGPAHGNVNRKTANPHKRGSEVASHPPMSAATALLGISQTPGTDPTTRKKKALAAKVLPKPPPVTETLSAVKDLRNLFL